MMSERHTLYRRCESYCRGWKNEDVGTAYSDRIVYKKIYMSFYFCTFFNSAYMNSGLHETFIFEQHQLTDELLKNELLQTFVYVRWRQKEVEMEREKDFYIHM